MAREEEKFDEEAFTEVDMQSYTKDYSEEGLWDKLVKNVQSIGLTLIYKALQLYYVTKNQECPVKVKLGIYAALGYLISPIDFIPDFTPFVGYADDASAIGVALLLAQMYIDDEVRESARNRIRELFGENALLKLDGEKGCNNH